MSEGEFHPEHIESVLAALRHYRDRLNRFIMEDVQMFRDPSGVMLSDINGEIDRATHLVAELETRSGLGFRYADLDAQYLSTIASALKQYSYDLLYAKKLFEKRFPASSLKFRAIDEYTAKLNEILSQHEDLLVDDKEKS